MDTMLLKFDLQDGAIWMDCRPEHMHDAVPFDVHHGLVLEFTLPSWRDYDEDAVVAHAREEIGDRLSLLRKGWSTGWDGNNTVGDYETAELSERAVDLECGIQCEIDHWELGRQIWTANQFFAEAQTYGELVADLGVRPDTDARELVRELVELAEHDGAPDGEPLTLIGADELAERLIKEAEAEREGNTFEGERR